jgi:hypothetical protein
MHVGLRCPYCSAVCTLWCAIGDFVCDNLLLLEAHRLPFHRVKCRRCQNVFYDDIGLLCEIKIGERFNTDIALWSQF